MLHYLETSGYSFGRLQRVTSGRGKELPMLTGRTLPKKCLRIGMERQWYEAGHIFLVDLFILHV